jgi:hypothetical protein
VDGAAAGLVQRRLRVRRFPLADSLMMDQVRVSPLRAVGGAGARLVPLRVGLSSGQGGVVDDEAVPHVGSQDSLVCLVDLPGRDDLDLRSQVMLRALCRPGDYAGPLSVAAGHRPKGPCWFGIIWGSGAGHSLTASKRETRRSWCLPGKTPLSQGHPAGRQAISRLRRSGGLCRHLRR